MATSGRPRELNPRDAELERFEAAVLPHMDAAYNLARWIVRDPADAQDAVQEAYLRAWKFFGSFRVGTDPRVWLFAVVRNTCFTWLKKHRAPAGATVSYDEEIHGLPAESGPGPDAGLLRAADAEVLREALAELPPEFREAVVLRELEELSYKEIADIAGVPLGTVMSRLARGRALLREIVLRRHRAEVEETARGETQ